MHCIHSRLHQFLSFFPIFFEKYHKANCFDVFAPVSALYWWAQVGRNSMPRLQSFSIRVCLGNGWHRFFFLLFSITQLRALPLDVVHHWSAAVLTECHNVKTSATRADVLKVSDAGDEESSVTMLHARGWSAASNDVVSLLQMLIALLKLTAWSCRLVQLLLCLLHCFFLRFNRALITIFWSK